MKTIDFDYPITSNGKRFYKRVHNLGEVYTCVDQIPFYMDYYNISFDVQDGEKTESYSTFTPHREDLFKFIIKIEKLLWPEEEDEN